jgi:hypothetical protein
MPYLSGEVERTSTRAIGGGGQADIYLGQWKGTEVDIKITCAVDRHNQAFCIQVAIKVIRVYNTNTGCPPPDEWVSYYLILCWSLDLKCDYQRNSFEKQQFGLV